MWRSIEGLSPAISIDQKSTNRNPRSTVGTVTEIYDYFRLLYARSRYSALPEMWEGDQKTDSRSDGGSDHAASGTDEDPAAGTGCTGTERGRMQKLLGQRRSAAVMSVYRLMEVCMN